MMTSSTIKHYTLESTIDSLAKVEQIIESLKEEFNIPEEIFGNILVSISEGMNNAIKHGNQFDSSKSVELSFDLGEKQYQFTIMDNGSGFDFNNVPDPTHPDNLEKVDGRGIFIMESLTDKIDYELGGSKVILTFNII
jgi:serine/threonine-protein kinase RsbW|tara:strand:+ start:6803 stop:7216 length:414 start_codon:yes stop_codon:yes gene_type:complete